MADFARYHAAYAGLSSNSRVRIRQNYSLCIRSARLRFGAALGFVVKSAHSSLR
jgi:hypothetical protein